MSKVAAYYHIVFCTKRREMTIPMDYREDLYRYIWKVISQEKCILLRIGGIQNHVHILLNLHPDVALSKVIREIKSLSSGWMRQDCRFGSFEGWAAGYFGCSVSPQGINGVIEYIMNQEAHHSAHPIDEEVERMYLAANIPYDPRDMR